jgi:hypothetical protein
MMLWRSGKASLPWAVGMLLAALCAGCGDDEAARLCAVGGDVTFNGKPVGAGKVVFTNVDPNAKPPKSVPVIFSSGHYETIAVPEGSYKVSIALPDAVNPPPIDIPEKYQKPETSGLTVEIKRGARTEYNIAMEP